MKTNALTPELFHKMDARRRAADSLSVGRIHLYDNPILKSPLTIADVKYMLLRYRGTTPGLNFVQGFTRIAGDRSGPTAGGRNRPL